LGGGCLLYRGLSGHCHGYEALGIDTAEHPDATAVPAQQGVKVERSVVVNRPQSEVYSYWRRLENLPQVLQHLQRVEVIDERHSRWFANGPLGTTLTWEAEVL